MPHSNIAPQTRNRARRLRREMTRAEKIMWDILRDFRPLGARFRQETPIGPYIADFAWLSARIVVEVDGHSHETEEGRRHDRRRDAFLAAEGFKVLRFDNDQVIDNPDHVAVAIDSHLFDLRESPDGGSTGNKPLPLAGRGWGGAISGGERQP